MSRHTRIKICGITTADDARQAVDAGADALGFVFAESPRRVAPEAACEIAAALPPLLTTVGVFADASPEALRRVACEAGLDLVQLHGDEPPGYCQEAERDLGRRIVKRFNVRGDDTPDTLRERIAAYGVRCCLLDPGRGSGRTFDWNLARDLPVQVILSGGLNPDNVGLAIQTLRPYAVDVSSGVEREPGRKCQERMRAFVRAVREADARNGA